MDKFEEQALAHFNTSHVNVNHKGQTIMFALIFNFNTSHVNVNRWTTATPKAIRIISIHLMLMLILKYATSVLFWKKFQYISC